jgi:uncharacterized protein
VTDDLSKLWTLAARQFPLGPYTAHGPDHWQRVERNGFELAATTGARVRVVRLFAVLHDSQRMNESYDPEHGLRAAEWAREIRGVAFDLPNDGDFDLLCEAMIWHDKGQTSPDPTIGTCWDADRLDLQRVGVRPLVKFMSTARGKALAESPPK